MGAGASVETEMSQADFHKLMMEKFSELDTNGSNFLENAEIEKVVDWTLELFSERFGDDKELARKKIMDRFDSNHDDKIDVAEFKVLFMEVFQRNVIVSKAKVKFAEFDTENKGYIESDKIKMVVDWTLSAFPFDNVDTYTKKLIAAIDINNDGKLSLLEFTNLFEQMLVRVDLVKRAKGKFIELDADKSGFLDGTEINSLVEWALSTYVEKTPEQRQRYAVNLMNKIDFNADGKISLTEFCDVFAEMLERAHLFEEAKEQFKKLDTNQKGDLKRSDLVGFVRGWIQKFCEFDVAYANVDALMDVFMAKIDVNHDDKISLIEFMETFEDTMTTYKPLHVVSVTVLETVAPSRNTSILDRNSMIADAIAEFKSLDANKSGFLEKNELRGVVRKWIQNYCEFEVSDGTNIDTLYQLFMSKIDVNHDNQISLMEFLDCFTATLAEQR